MLSATARQNRPATFKMLIGLIFPHCPPLEALCSSTLLYGLSSESWAPPEHLTRKSKTITKSGGTTPFFFFVVVFLLKWRKGLRGGALIFATWKNGSSSTSWFGKFLAPLNFLCWAFAMTAWEASRWEVLRVHRSTTTIWMMIRVAPFGQSGPLQEGAGLGLKSFAIDSSWVSSKYWDLQPIKLN